MTTPSGQYKYSISKPVMTISMIGAEIRRGLFIGQKSDLIIGGLEFRLLLDSTKSLRNSTPEGSIVVP